MDPSNSSSHTDNTLESGQSTQADSLLVFLEQLRDNNNLSELPPDSFHDIAKDIVIILRSDETLELSWIENYLARLCSIFITGKSGCLNDYHIFGLQIELDTFFNTMKCFTDIAFQSFVSLCLSLLSYGPGQVLNWLDCIVYLLKLTTDEKISPSQAVNTIEQMKEFLSKSPLKLETETEKNRFDLIFDSKRELCQYWKTRHDSETTPACGLMVDEVESLFDLLKQQNRAYARQ